VYERARAAILCETNECASNDRCETFAFAVVATRRGCLRRDERVLK